MQSTVIRLNDSRPVLDSRWGETNDCWPIHLDSCTSKDGSTAAEMIIDISRARAAYVGVRHLWSRPAISLNLEGRVHCRIALSLVVWMPEFLFPGCSSPGGFRSLISNWYTKDWVQCMRG